MIYKRFAANLRAQNWFAIAVELGIVILGVYIGTWVANRNQEAVARGNTVQLLNQLRPEITYQASQYQKIRTYMTTTGHYADVAFAGWRRDPKVSDNEFVIAAYEASQAAGSQLNANNWASIFGANQVQNIRDADVRKRLIRVLSSTTSGIDAEQVYTRYRERVREVIPSGVQDKIRSQCDDVFGEDATSIPTLSPTCALKLTPVEAAAAAAALRARPELVSDLNWHRAAVASMLYNFESYVKTLEALGVAIDRSSDAGAQRAKQ